MQTSFELSECRGLVKAAQATRSVQILRSMEWRVSEHMPVQSMLGEMLECRQFDAIVSIGGELETSVGNETNHRGSELQEVENYLIF